MVIVDWFTKMTGLKTTTIAVSSEDIAKIYQNEIWKIHKIPWKVLSDRESQFVSRFIEDLEKTLETKWTLSMAYYLQTDKQMEKIN